MKKILYIIGFLMFSSALLSPVLSRTALGADNGAAVQNNDDCSFPWIRCAHDVVNIPDVDWGATFGTSLSSEVGQNLYENVLEMTKVAPDKKAFKNTASAFGTTESETVQLLRGDFSPIIAKNPYLTQEDAVHKMTEFQQQYNDEKDIFTLQAGIEAAVTPNEIFVNGDVADSGFDLINDLNNIENILFKKMDPIDVGGTFKLGTGGGGGAGAAPETGAGAKPANGAAASGDGGAADTGANGGAAPSGASGLNPKPTPAKNPSICFADDKLDVALQNFDNKKVNDAHLKETASKPQTDTLTTPATAGSGAASTVASSGGAGFGAPLLGATPTAQPQPPLQPAPADDWLKSPPCGEILCIQINFVKKTATAYVDSDNCIACHVEKITEKLKKTVDHSLIPGKATGNLLEPGICKQAAASLFGTVNMHMYVLTKPIITPQNDDLIYGTNAADEWDKFVNTTKFLPFYEKKIPDPNDPNQDASIPTVEDRAAKAAGAYATETTKQSVVSDAIQQEITKTQDTIDHNTAVAEAVVQNESDTSFYQSIRRELEQMNYYFVAYQKLLHNINEQVKGEPQTDHACQIIKEIKQCT